MSSEGLAIEDALALVREEGGVAGALLTIQNRLRAQLGEQRDTIRMLHSRLDDQAGEIANLRVAVSDLQRVVQPSPLVEA